MDKSLVEEKKKTKGVKIYCDIKKCVGCKSCEIACAVEHSRSQNIFTVLKEDSLPKQRVRVKGTGGKIIFVRCQHCKNALCIKACESGALSKNEESGAVIEDEEKCIGCWKCVAACPFDAIVKDTENNIVLKCDLCPKREDFACVTVCPTGALFAGSKEEFEERLKKKKVKKRK